MASVAHAMGHVLGAVFHVPHGRAVSLCLPYTVEFAARQVPDRLSDLAALLGCAGGDAAEETACNLAARIRGLAREVGNPTSVAQLGVARETFEGHLEKLVDDALNDTQMLTACRSPSYDEMRQLFLYAYDGRPIDF